MPADRRAGVAVRFATLGLIWGSSFLLVKAGLQRYEPAQLALLRMATGAAALLVVVRLSGLRLPRDRRVWLHLAVVAALLNAVPYTLVALGETHVSSALAGIWNGATPLATLAVVLLLFPEERPTRERVTGLLVGFAGVVVVVAPWRDLDGGQLLGQALLAGMALCYGFGTPYARRYVSARRVSLTALAAAQLLVGTLETALLVPFTGLPPLGADRATLAVAVLGAVGTGLAYILYYGLIRDLGSTGAAAVTYLTVVVAVALGVVVLGESVTLNEPLGTAVVLLGVAISQRRPSRSGTPGFARQPGFSGPETPGVRADAGMPAHRAADEGPRPGRNAGHR